MAHGHKCITNLQEEILASTSYGQTFESGAYNKCSTTQCSLFGLICDIKEGKTKATKFFQYTPTQWLPFIRNAQLKPP